MQDFRPCLRASDRQLLRACRFPISCYASSFFCTNSDTPVRAGVSQLWSSPGERRTRSRRAFAPGGGGSLRPRPGPPLACHREVSRSRSAASDRQRYAVHQQVVDTFRPTPSRAGAVQTQSSQAASDFQTRCKLGGKTNGVSFKYYSAAFCAALALPSASSGPSWEPLARTFGSTFCIEIPWLGVFYGPVGHRGASRRRA